MIGVMGGEFEVRGAPAHITFMFVEVLYVWTAEKQQSHPLSEMCAIS
jgi:hypothetical protein